MANRVVLVCGVVVAASLYFVYGLATILFLQHLEFSTISLVESAVMITLAVRLAWIVSHYGAKPARIEVLLVLLSLEGFVVIGLIIVYLISSDAGYSDLAYTIFSTWTAALFTVLPAYLVFAGVAQMIHLRSLIAVLLSLTLEFGFLVFAASTMLGFGGTFTFGSFFDFLMGAVKADVASGTIPGLSSFAILVPSVALYIAMLVYSTVPTATSAVPPKVNFVILLLSAGTALGWVSAAVFIAPNAPLSFTAPAMILVAVLWAYMRR